MAILGNSIFRNQMSFFERSIGSMMKTVDRYVKTKKGYPAKSKIDRKQG